MGKKRSSLLPVQSSLAIRLCEISFTDFWKNFAQLSHLRVRESKKDSFYCCCPCCFVMIGDIAGVFVRMFKQVKFSPPVSLCTLPL